MTDTIEDKNQQIIDAVQQAADGLISESELIEKLEAITGAIFAGDDTGEDDQD